MFLLFQIFFFWNKYFCTFSGYPEFEKMVLPVEQLLLSALKYSNNDFVKLLVKLTVVLDHRDSMETYGRIGLLRIYGNLQSYWTTTKLWKLTVVLDYCGATKTYSRIGLLPSYGSLQSYWTTAGLRKPTVVLDLYLPN